MPDELVQAVLDALDDLHHDPERTDAELRQNLEFVELYVREKRQAWT